MTFPRIQIGVLAAAATLLVAACGTATDDGGPEPELASIATTSIAPETANEPSDDQAPEVDTEEVFARFEACMADYGVDVSFGSGGGATVPGETSDDVPTEPVTEEKMEEAESECGPILDESFGSFDLDPEQEAEMADQMLALQLCLADEGYDIEISGNGFSPGQISDIDEFNVALNRCSQEIGLGSVEGSGS